LCGARNAQPNWLNAISQVFSFEVHIGPTTGLALTARSFGLGELEADEDSPGVGLADSGPVLMRAVAVCGAW
jgi:hypothetical protein